MKTFTKADQEAVNKINTFFMTLDPCDMGPSVIIMGVLNVE